MKTAIMIQQPPLALDETYVKDLALKVTGEDPGLTVAGNTPRLITDAITCALHNSSIGLSYCLGQKAARSRLLALRALTDRLLDKVVEV